MKKNSAPDKDFSEVSNLGNPISKIVVSRGNPFAKLMIVGEAPGAKEEELGEPLWEGLESYLISCFKMQESISA